MEGGRPAPPPKPARHTQNPHLGIFWGLKNLCLPARHTQNPQVGRVFQCPPARYAETIYKRPKQIESNRIESTRTDGTH